MEPVIKRCGCGAAYTQAQWDALGYVGQSPVDDDEPHEMRLCDTCRSTIAIVMDASPKSRPRAKRRP